MCAGWACRSATPSVIREQAAEKHLDPALIAAVIYAETKFDPRPSPAGARGAHADPAWAPPTTCAQLSGGRRFTARDLATPSINVAYGSYYLRYLLQHYNGNEMLAVAAYNAGLANVDSWVAQANAAGTSLTVGDDPIPGDPRLRAARAGSPARVSRRLLARAGAVGLHSFPSGSSPFR